MLDLLLKQIISNKPELLGIEDVIEKEILHHDIMTVLHRKDLLRRLTFIGGTSLRLCYQSNRLSEDLDFTAGSDFTADQFLGLGDEIKKHLEKKYGLNVSVYEPKKSLTDTSTWKITIEKHRNRPDLPSQKMHIDICSLPSFEIEHRPIIDHYAIGSSMAGLPIPVQSMSEILADKMVAFAFRERRIKPRDVWDIVWLKQQSIDQNPELVIKKLVARKKSTDDFLAKINQHALMVRSNADTKKKIYDELSRFLPRDVSKRTLHEENFWKYLSTVIEKEVKTLSDAFNNSEIKKNQDFKM